MNKSQFYGQLEGLRGLAVTLVLVSHFVIISHFPKLIFLKFGFWGVNIFFVLSGFLITQILLKGIYDIKKPFQILRNFYLKRTLRIFPIYYLTIICLAFFHIDNTNAILPYSLTYSLNIGSLWITDGSGILMHFWSLCVEEQFYLVWPFLLLITNRKNHLFLIISLIILSILIKFAFCYFHFKNYQIFCNGSTPASFDALSIGGLIAYLKLNKPLLLNKLVNFKYIPIVLAILFWTGTYFSGDNSLFYNVFGRIITALTSFCIVSMGALNVPSFLGRILSNNTLRYIGKISYGIYIYHWIIFFLFRGIFYKWWVNVDFGLFYKLKYNVYLGSFLFFFVASIIIASISFYLIERPILSLKEKLT